MLPGHVRRMRSTSTNSSGDCAPRALSRRSAEDPLAELSRLVEFSHMGIANGETPARRAAEPAGRARGAFDLDRNRRLSGQRSTMRWKNSLPARPRPIARRGGTTSSTPIIPTALLQRTRARSAGQCAGRSPYPRWRLRAWR